MISIDQMDLMTIQEAKAREQCEQLEKAWQVLNEAAAELASRVTTLPPDIFVSLRGAKDLISLCKSHPKVDYLTSGNIDSYEGFCVACCGSDIVGRIKCELRNIEDMMVLTAMNELGSPYALRLQEKMMKSWEATKPLTV
jgi:hypothetical protein